MNFYSQSRLSLSRRASWLNTLIFVLVFCGLALWLAVTTAADKPRIPDDLQVLNYAEDAEVIFIGSSYTLWQINPDLIESFNSIVVGYKALSGYEVDRVIEKILRLRPPNLKYIVIELRPYHDFVLPEGFSTRDVRWHNFGRTVAAVKDLWRRDLTNERRYSLAWKHIKYYLEHVRRHNPLIKFLKSVAVELRLRQSELRLPVSETGFGYWESYLYNEARYLGELAAFREGHSRSQGGFYFNLQELMRHKELIKDRNIQPVYLVPPNLLNCATEHRLHDEGYLENVIFLCNPDRYPALFDPSNRMDITHLNHEGLVIYTRLVEEKLLEVMQDSATAKLPS